jgi:predicted DNA-binding protein (UPF0251 family)
MSTPVKNNLATPIEASEQSEVYAPTGNGLCGIIPVTATAKSAPQVKMERLGYTVLESAQILGISTRSVHRLLKRGLLRASKALRKIIIPRVEIEKFLRDTTGEI